MPVYSIIVPCYNEEAVLHETHKRLTQVMQKMDGDYEIVYVNDGSRDKTPVMLNDLVKNDPCVRVVHFARNAGHQIAVTAGLDYASGDDIVIIDADLQDPPEVIPEMAKKWRAGAQVVYGQRKHREGETFFKKLTAHVYYRLLQAMTNVDIPADTGDFRLVDKQVADVVRSMPEHARYLRGMFAWAGFKQEPLLYDRDKRFAGETHYPLKKMIKLALDGMISFSDRLVKIITVLGILSLVLGGGMAFVLLILLCTGTASAAWWLADLMILCTGVILTSLGILGAYIDRIYDETRARPLYIVAESRGFPAEHKPFSR